MSTSLISNNRLSQSENMIPLLTWKSQYVIKYISNFQSQFTYSFVKCGCSVYFCLNSANLIRGDMGISKHFNESNIEMRCFRKQQWNLNGSNILGTINNRLSRSENMVSVLTWKSQYVPKYCGKSGEIARKEQFLLFSTIFSIYL